MTVFTVAIAGLNYYPRDGTRMGGMILSREQIGSEHSRDERSNCLDSTASFRSSPVDHLASPFSFPFPCTRVFSSFIERSSGRCNRITRDTYATGTACNSTRYVALSVLAWLSLDIPRGL